MNASAPFGKEPRVGGNRAPGGDWNIETAQRTRREKTKEHVAFVVRHDLVALGGMLREIAPQALHRHFLRRNFSAIDK